MAVRRIWARDELLVAGLLYCRIPFGRFHSRNPEIVRVAKALDRTPDALAMKLSNLASVDPTFRSSGRSGLSGASANDRALWQEMNADWSAFALNSEVALAQLEVDQDSGRADQPPDYTGDERVTTRRERVGQSLFRDAVLSAYDFRCCISGLAVPRLLNASHIVPWREDPGNRLNPANGLCLSALHDRAFDTGLITVLEDFTLAVTRNAPADAGTFFESAIGRYEGQSINLPEKFAPAPEFLARHRDEVFIG